MNTNGSRCRYLGILCKNYVKFCELNVPSGISTASIVCSKETPIITRITCVTVSLLANVAFTPIGVHSCVASVWLEN